MLDVIRLILIYVLKKVLDFFMGLNYTISTVREEVKTMLTFDELLEVLLEDGETVTIEDYDDFFIIETTFEEEE